MIVERFHYIISGRVQGVGFRFFTKQHADRIGVVGSVRNLADGRVEADAQGDTFQLQEFETMINRGPSFGRVNGVVKTALGLGHREGSFVIAY